MSVCWAALEIDPVPGDPAAVLEVSRAVDRLATRLGTGAAQLRQVATDRGVWDGPAAGAFRDRLGVLPAELDDAAQALRHVGRALVGYADRLEELQARARRLAEDAAVAHRRLPDPIAQAELAALRQAALGLRSQARAESGAVERALRAAAELAPCDPGWLHRLVTEHAQVLRVAATVLSVAALATGVGAPVAVGLMLTAGSLGASCLLYHYGEADEQDLLLATAGALTAGLGALPRLAGAAGAVTVSGAAASGAARGSVTADAVLTVTPRGVGAGAGMAARVGAVADDVGAKLAVYGGYDLVSGPVRRAAGDARRRDSDAVLAPGVLPAPKLPVG